jgi:hypothetical protein
MSSVAAFHFWEESNRGSLAESYLSIHQPSPLSRYLGGSRASILAERY